MFLYELKKSLNFAHIVDVLEMYFGYFSYIYSKETLHLLALFWEFDF